MRLTKNKKIILISAAIAFVALSTFMAYELFTTYHAHDTFEGYCKWRGLEVTNLYGSFGYCNDPVTKMNYKIVQYEGRWYLDGDLPCGFLCF